MPFVNIYVPSGFNSETKKAISVAIQESLVTIFNVPVNDCFQVIHAVDPEHLIFPDHYLDIPHTSDLVYIYITCGNGRTIEMKKALYIAIAEKISHQTTVSINDVIIVLNETLWENWSFGQGKAQMIK